MRAAINAPSLHVRELDYLTECRFAIEPSIRGLLDAAEQAGWDREYATLAVIAVASGLTSDFDEVQVS